MRRAELSSALTAAIERVGTSGRLRYTERQLYYEVCRVLRPEPGLTRRQANRALLVGLLPALWQLHRRPVATWLALADVMVVGGGLLLRRVPYTLTPPIAYARFADILRAHCETNGRPSGLLPAASSQSLSFDGREPDLLDYGLPRLLVCQHTDLTNMLRANNLHMEMSCAILSLDEATPLPISFCSMLVRAPSARIFLLHDASPEGLAVVHGLRERLKLPVGMRTKVIGLRPAHARRLHLFAEHSPRPTDVPDQWPAYLSTAERTWLNAGWRAELYAVEPLRLLRALGTSMRETAPNHSWLTQWRSSHDVGFMDWPIAYPRAFGITSS